MDLNKKIEEIRQKPEHIRMRYVWGGVVIVMIFILIIWLFSLQDKFKATENENISDLKNKIEEQKKNMPSLGDLLKNDKKSNTTNQEGVRPDNKLENTNNENSNEEINN